MLFFNVFVFQRIVLISQCNYHCHRLNKSYSRLTTCIPILYSKVFEWFLLLLSFEVSFTLPTYLCLWSSFVLQRNLLLLKSLTVPTNLFLRKFFHYPNKSIYFFLWKSSCSPNKSLSLKGLPISEQICLIFFCHSLCTYKLSSSWINEFLVLYSAFCSSAKWVITDYCHFPQSLMNDSNTNVKWYACQHTSLFVQLYFDC